MVTAFIILPFETQDKFVRNGGFLNEQTRIGEIHRQ